MSRPSCLPLADKDMRQRVDLERIPHSAGMESL